MPLSLLISAADAACIASSERSKWDKLDGLAELGVRGPWEPELRRTARSVARRVRDGLPVACDEERDEDGEGTSKGCLSCRSMSVSCT